MSNAKTPSSKQLNMKFPHRKVGNRACWIISQIAWKLAARPEARLDLVFWPPESPWPQTTFALVRHCLLWFLYLVPFLCWMNKERREMKRTSEFPGFSSQNTFLRDENIRTLISNIPFLMDISASYSRNQDDLITFFVFQLFFIRLMFLSIKLGNHSHFFFFDFFLTSLANSRSYSQFCHESLLKDVLLYIW